MELAAEAPTAAPSGLARQGELVEAAQEFARAAKSRATLRAYAADLRHFDAWCAAQGRAPLPAEPATVAFYVTHLARSGTAASTIQRRLAAISQVHQLDGHVPPPPRTGRSAR